MIKFTKMHGLGNDFMVVDGISQDIHFRPDQISRLAQHHTGIGFDQLLLIERSQDAEIDFNYRIFNANGQEVGQCGNGARCVAVFAKYYGLTHKNDLRIATKTTQMQLHIKADNSVTVALGIPKLTPAEIPLNREQQAETYQLDLREGTKASLHALSVGNPHAVLLVPDTATAPVADLGQQISVHPHFPAQTNVGFMEILSPAHIKLRVYERGCGETLACGSGAVAAAAIGRLYYQLEPQVKVTLPGGDLTIDWPSMDDQITLTGPANFVYEGFIFPSML